MNEKVILDSAWLCSFNQIIISPFNELFPNLLLKTTEIPNLMVMGPVPKIKEKTAIF